jgi:hypothetical protein
VIQRQRCVQRANSHRFSRAAGGFQTSSGRKVSIFLIKVADNSSTFQTLQKPKGRRVLPGKPHRRFPRLICPRPRHQKWVPRFVLQSPCPKWTSFPRLLINSSKPQKARYARAAANPPKAPRAHVRPDGPRSNFFKTKFLQLQNEASMDKFSKVFLPAATVCPKRMSFIKSSSTYSKPSKACSTSSKR